MPDTTSALRTLAPELARYRLGPSTGSTTEHRLAAAAQAGRQQAADRLAGRFGGFRLDATRQNIDAKVPAIFETAPWFLDQLDAVDAVDRALRGSDVRPGHLRFADGTRRGAIPEVADHITDPAGEAGVHELLPFATAMALRDEYTVVFNNLVPRLRGPLQDLTDDLARVLGTMPQVNAYISERGAPGFGRHWDDHDVVILQMTGRKQWTLFEPSDLSPRLGYTSSRAFGDDYFTTVLEPGLGLYLPRGWGHEVKGFPGEQSVHYTVGIRHLTMIDVLNSRISELASEDGSARVSLDDPLGFPSLHLGADEIEHAIGAHRARFTSFGGGGPLTIFRLAEREFDGAAFSAAFTGGLVLADHPALADGEVAFGAAGHVFAVAGPAIDDIEALLAGRRLVVDRSHPDSGSVGSLPTLTRLARFGVVAVDRADRVEVR